MDTYGTSRCDRRTEAPYLMDIKMKKANECVRAWSTHAKVLNKTVYRPIHGTNMKPDQFNLLR